MVGMIDRTKDVKSKRSNCVDEIIRNAQLDVAEELRKQQLEVDRVDTALSFLEELELSEMKQVKV